MLFRSPHFRCNYIFNKTLLFSGLDIHFTKTQWMVGEPRTLVTHRSHFSPTGAPGSGAGKGGGGGGSVRESGGGLGRFGAAQEEQFFFNKQREQLEKIKKKLKEVPTAKAGDLTRKEEK